MTMMAGGPEPDDAGERPVLQGPSGELTIALQLLRASNMASTRLQLALTRRDRRVAMAALDNITAIDAELEELANRFSGSDDAAPELAALGTWLTEEKAALTAEKLTFACDARGPGLVSAPDRLSEVADEEEHAAVGPEDEPVPEPDAVGLAAAEAAPARRWWLFVLLIILIIVVAAGLVVAGVLPGSEKMTGMAELRRLIGIR